MDESRYRQAEQRLWDWIGVKPSERTVRLTRNNVTVRVQELGKGPSVVFVHGANVNGSSWATLSAALQDFHCILLDRPGTGLSESLKASLDPESLSQLGDSLVIDVMDALGIESSHLVGTSFGGYIALRSAARHPHRIDRMIQFSWRSAPRSIACR